jgi:hypothetical protein
MQPGIAALTCAAQQTDASSNSVPAANAFPFGLVDLRNPSPVPHYTTLGSGAILWNPPMYHHPDWSVDKIGCVFGIAVDRDGNIYLAAHSLYVPFWGPPWFGNPYLMLGSLAGPNPTNASGTIYRVDALTGNVTVFAVLPQQADPNLPWNPAAGPGIGNLTYDPAHDQFFATNLEDGKIYRLTKSGITGVIAEVYDPLAPDNGLPGMPPLGTAFGPSRSRAPTFSTPSGTWEMPPTRPSSAAWASRPRGHWFPHPTLWCSAYPVAPLRLPGL